jgi:hypothetical protein
MNAVSNNQSFFDVALWVGLLIVAVLAMAGVMVYTRRRTLDDESNAEIPTLSLQRLREWRDSGEISIQEYERLRATMTKQFTGAEASGGGGRSPDDVTEPVSDSSISQGPVPASSSDAIADDKRNGAGGVDSRNENG